MSDETRRCPKCGDTYTTFASSKATECRDCWDTVREAQEAECKALDVLNGMQLRVTYRDRRGNPTEHVATVSVGRMSAMLAGLNKMGWDITGTELVSGK